MNEENHFTDENGRELTWNELFSNASVRQANSLAENPEWSQKITIHIHEVVTAFSIGIQQSYPWYSGFQLPPNFETVMNKMSFLLQNEFMEQWRKFECIEVSLLKLKGVYKRLAMSIPDYVEWNDIGNPQGEWVGTSIMDFGNIKTEPSFIDLDVPPHNAVLYLRNCERDHKRFDKEFEEKYGNLEVEEEN